MPTTRRHQARRQRAGQRRARRHTTPPPSARAHLGLAEHRRRSLLNNADELRAEARRAERDARARVRHLDAVEQDAAQSPRAAHRTRHALAVARTRALTVPALLDLAAELRAHETAARRRHSCAASPDTLAPLAAARVRALAARAEAAVRQCSDTYPRRAHRSRTKPQRELLVRTRALVAAPGAPARPATGQPPYAPVPHLNPAT